MNNELNYIPLIGGLSDLKQYGFTTLNGMKILIISNQLQQQQQQIQLQQNEKDKKNNHIEAAAALIIETGSFNDPNNLQGLSHYLEHMLFMGSEKYPGENEYDSFITSNGGYCNAYTECEYTLYNFDIPYEHFFNALDIFANCFISPLLNNESSSRELKAIESEFQTACTSDEARLEDLMCHFAESTHIIRKFFWGNIKSLQTDPLYSGVNVNETLRNYYNQYYYPENAKLVVMAPYSITEILQKIHQSFSQWKCNISQNLLPQQLSINNPFPTSPYLLRNIPIGKNKHLLKIYWTIPHTLSNYHNKCDEYLAHLIGHESQGSILSNLKKLNLADSIIAGVGSNGIEANASFSIFTITIGLTQSGVILWTQVVKIIFQYLSFLSQNQLEEWIFHELQKLGQIEYDYQDEIDVEDFVVDMAVEMTKSHGRQITDLLTARYLFNNWDPEGIHLLLNELKPEKCQISITSSLFLDYNENKELDQSEQNSDDSIVSNSSHDHTDDDDDDDDDDDSDYGDDDSDYDSDDNISEKSFSIDEITKLLNSVPESHRKLCQLPHLHCENEIIDENSINKISCQKSEYFGYIYWKDLINDDIINYWSDNLSFVSGVELHFPPKNPYISTKLNLSSSSSTTTTSSSSSLSTSNKLVKSNKNNHNHNHKNINNNNNNNNIPQIIFHSSTIKLWYLSSPQYNIPKGVINITFLSNYFLQITSKQSELAPLPYLTVMNELFVFILREYLNNEIYLAKMAYMDCDIISSIGGIIISAYGFYDKVPILIKTILKEIVNYTKYLSDKLINQQIELLKRQYQNESLLSQSAAKSKRLEILLPHQPSKDTCLETLINISNSNKSIKQLLIKYLNNFFNSCFSEILVYGHISYDIALSIGNSIDSLLNKTRSNNHNDHNHNHNHDNHNHKIKKQKKILFNTSSVYVQPIESTINPVSYSVTPKSEKERNKCFQIYFQIGLINPQDLVVLNLIEKIMEEPLFNELRTKQQLGYDVSCYTCETYSMLGYTIEVVSSSHELKEIYQIVLDFINNIFNNYIQNLAINELHAFQNANMSSLCTPPKSIIDASLRYWTEIEERRYNFNIIQDQVNILSTLQLQDIYNFYEKHFINISTRRVIIIECSKEEEEELK